MAWSTMSSQSAEAKISSAEWNKIVGNFSEIGDAGTEATGLTLGGTGWSLGNGTSIATYQNRSKWIVGQYELKFGSTTSAGSGALTVALPTGTAVSSQAQILKCAVYDDSAGTLNAAEAHVAASATVMTTNVTSSTISFATNDLVLIEFRIEIA